MHELQKSPAFRTLFVLQAAHRCLDSPSHIQILQIPFSFTNLYSPDFLLQLRQIPFLTFSSHLLQNMSLSHVGINSYPHPMQLLGPCSKQSAQKPSTVPSVCFPFESFNAVPQLLQCLIAAQSMHKPFLLSAGASNNLKQTTHGSLYFCAQLLQTTFALSNSLIFVFLPHLGQITSLSLPNSIKQA